MIPVHSIHTLTSNTPTPTRWDNRPSHFIMRIHKCQPPQASANVRPQIYCSVPTSRHVGWCVEFKARKRFLLVSQFQAMFPDLSPRRLPPPQKSPPQTSRYAGRVSACEVPGSPFPLKSSPVDVFLNFASVGPRRLQSPRRMFNSDNITCQMWAQMPSLAGHFLH